MRRTLILLLFTSLICGNSWAATNFYCRHPFSLFLYKGDYTKTSLIDNFKFKVNKVDDEYMYGMGLSYVFKNYFYACNLPLLNFSTGVDFYLADDVHKHIYQGNTYLALNIISPVLFNLICVGITVGDGISFSTGIPSYELQEGGTSKTLNYFFYDLVLFSPKFAHLQLLYHTAHRCNCHGFIYPPHDGVVGSTAIGLGVRYFF